MKRKLLLLSVLIICLSVLATGTLAYFNAENAAHNIITTGGVNIEVVEQMRDGDTLIDFPEQGINGVMPGASVSKIVKVKNTGGADAWIRVKVSMSVEGVRGNVMPLFLSDGTAVMTFTVMEGWTDGGDGYFYYNRPVAADELTDVLFNEVCFAPAMGNEYQNCTANIFIGAQAVQSANNEIPYGGNAADVSGWPEE